MLTTINRRQFTLGTAALASLSLKPVRALAKSSGSTKYKYCAFVKFLTALNYEELADAIAGAGFDGVEVTARHQDSYIHPERAADELPKLKEALDRRGLEITILTSDILREDDADAEPLLRTAAKLGIKRYRLGFHRYDLAKPVLPQLAALVPVFRDIAAMNREIGIAALYQNHCGADMVGATMWDLHSLIKDYPLDEIGCVFDIRHAAVEGGEAWPVYFNLITPHVGAVSVKDFRWQGRKSQHVPLGEGQVDPKFFTMLQATKFDGPISVHVEYLTKANAKENVAALKRDLKTLKGWMQKKS
jgi:sugar phosphate isomerase/epimerase